MPGLFNLAHEFDLGQVKIAFLQTITSLVKGHKYGQDLLGLLLEERGRFSDAVHFEI